MKIKLVIDANILFASLITDGLTANLLFSEKYQCYAPEFLFEEFQKYNALILKKSHRTQSELKLYLKKFKSQVKIVPMRIIQKSIPKAKEFSPDPKDTVYLALALALDCAIWSNDKALKENQNEVLVLNTSEILKQE